MSQCQDNNFLKEDYFMRPLAETLTNESENVNFLINQHIDSHHIFGFFLDSKRADLKRSGLISHRDSVMPLESLLGDRVTLYYVDPMRSATDYRKAVEAFVGQVFEVGLVKFRINPPALLIVQAQYNQVPTLEYLPLDPEAMCIWHSQVDIFLRSIINKQVSLEERSKFSGLLESLSSKRTEISIEILKSGLGSLISSLVSAR